MAEETVIALSLREPALLDRAGELKPEEFSVSLLGKVYEQLIGRHRQGLEVSVAVLTELTAEEMSHVVLICQRQQGPISEQAFDDCVRIIKGEHQSASVDSEDDLLALRNKLKEKKGIH